MYKQFPHTHCPELSTRACLKNGLMSFYMHMISGKTEKKIIGQAWPPGVYTYLDNKVEETYNYQDILGAIFIVAYIYCTVL